MKLDPLAVQRCLAGLEERYCELYENAEARFEALLAERNVQEKESDAAHQQLVDLSQELVNLKQKFVFQNQEKEESLQQLIEVKQQLEMQAMERETAQQQLEAQSEELKQSQNYSELTLLQLHQVQEELENYFLLSRHQDELLSSYSNLLQRIAVLISQSSNLPAGE